MPISTGLISAFILYKKRPNALTRLQKLTKKLQQKVLKQQRLTKKIIYSYPVKYLFLIFVILMFIGAMILFLEECRIEMVDNIKGRDNDRKEMGKEKEKENIKSNNNMNGINQLNIEENILKYQSINNYHKTLQKNSSLLKINIQNLTQKYNSNSNPNSNLPNYKTNHNYNSYSNIQLPSKSNHNHNFIQSLQLTIFYHCLSIQNFITKFSQSIFQSNVLIMQSSHIIKYEKDYRKLHSTISMVVLFFIVVLVVLMVEINFQRIKILGMNGKQKENDNQSINQNEKNDKQNGKIGQIHKEIFSLFYLRWRIQKIINVHQNDKFIIQLCGPDTFTYKNNYYAVKLIISSHSNPNNPNTKSQSPSPQNIPQINKISGMQKLILKHGNIYQSRKTIIYLSHVMKKQQQINLKIKNGPIRKGKSPIF